jgi:hypothetical protein
MNQLPKVLIKCVCTYLLKIDIIFLACINKYFEKTLPCIYTKVKPIVYYWAPRYHIIILSQINIYLNAASQGYVEILEYLKNVKYNFDDGWTMYLCDYAAKNGHLNVLKWARNNQCKWNSNVCSYAAKIGNLEIIQWINALPVYEQPKHKYLVYRPRMQNCGWKSDQNICSSAIFNGHKHVVKWALENGCEMSDKFKFAKIRTFDEICEYIDKNKNNNIKSKKKGKANKINYIT